jgi:hypothetical protein
MQGMNDLLKTQMILGLWVGRTPLMNIFALNLFEIATRTFPTWSTWGKTVCCSRR